MRNEKPLLISNAFGARLFSAFALGVTAYGFGGLLGAFVVAMLGVAVYLHWQESQR